MARTIDWLGCFISSYHLYFYITKSSGNAPHSRNSGLNQALVAVPYRVVENYGPLPHNHTRLWCPLPSVDRNKKQSNLVLRLPPLLLSLSHSTLLYTLSPSKFSFLFHPLHLTWHHTDALRMWRADPLSPWLEKIISSWRKLGICSCRGPTPLSP